MKEQLSPKAMDLIAERFRILSEPVRLRILHLLRDGELSVNALTVSLGTSQPNASKHLKILQDAGIVGRRQDGNSVYYSIIDSSIFDLCELVCGSLEMQFRANAEVFATV
jgi:DNA-binding transcriptional ArsR family regulator